MSSQTKTTSHLSRLPKELRDKIYICLLDDENDIYFHTFSHRELPDVLQAAEPLLGFDTSGAIHIEALTHWLRTRKFIFEDSLALEWQKISEPLTSHGLDIYAELRRAEIWVWSEHVLLERVAELSACTNIKSVKVLLGEGITMSALQAARLFQGFKGPMQVQIYREDEYVENEEPVCEKIVTIPEKC